MMISFAAMNPASPGGAPTGYEAWDEPVPAAPRTSILAITSLILTLLCLTAPLGLLVGIAALVRIATSNGRRTGVGLSVASVVIAIVISSAMAFLAVGAVQVTKMMVQTPVAIMTQIEAGDFAAARKHFSEQASAGITDADFVAFREAYRAKAGAFKGGPTSLLEMFSLYKQAKGGLQTLGQQQRQDAPIFPLPMHFEKGVVVVVIGMDVNPGSGQRSSPFDIADGLTILGNDNERIDLGPGVKLFRTPPPPPPKKMEMPGTSPEGKEGTKNEGAGSSQTPAPPSSPTPPASPTSAPGAQPAEGAGAEGAKPGPKGR